MVKNWKYQYAYILTDEHKKLTTTSMVFNRIKKEIALLNEDTVLSCEVKYKGENWKQYLLENYKALKQLEIEIKK